MVCFSIAKILSLVFSISIESNTCFSFDFILSRYSMLLIGLNGGLVAVGVVFIFSLAPDGHGGSMSFSVNHSSCHCAFLSHLLCWWLHCPCLFFCFMLWSLTGVISCCCTHCHYSSSQMFVLLKTSCRPWNESKSQLIQRTWYH